MPNADMQPIAYVPPSNTLYNRLKTPSSTSETKLRPDLTRLTLSRDKWNEILTTNLAHDLNRLHYYQPPRANHHDLQALGKHVFTTELGNFHDHPLELAASVYDDTYLYIFLTKQGTDNDIAAIAVFRPNANVFTIRVREDDQAASAFHRLKEDFQDPSEHYRGPKENQPEFDGRFHTQFETDLVDRYDRIWIAFSDYPTDNVLNKVQFLAEGQNNAKESTHVTNILSEEGTKIYGGRVEASGLALTTPRTFFFNWFERRITFQQRPSEQTKLEISDSLLRIYDRMLSPPLDRILSPGTAPIRVEFYDNRTAATWQGYTTLRGFLDHATEQLDGHSQTITYHEEGTPTVTELANLREEPPNDVTFVRVGGEQQTLTWEPNTTGDGNQCVFGLISGVHSTNLASLYEQTVEGAFSKRAAETIADISQKTEVAE
ncbi:hypothetical protein V5735_19090 [Haladaptatus sp. SPP-AMP-3]|uniref:hypothetical protein n=1 Tax=Haladaptatus sp. SPP-AMP-3 TaxID=3121295 RepID=UPI003C2B9FC1